ncbi:hypothetical protein J3R04_000486 [Spirilliplanes yamanashiensis]|nr:hypothetical protein [Spirilliplanes yamanashiensis]
MIHYHRFVADLFACTADQVEGVLETPDETSGQPD